KPSQRVRVPNSRTITSTDSRAMSNRLCTRAANTAGSPPSNQRASAASAAIRKKPSHRPLSISNSISSATRRASYQAAEEHKRSAAAVQPRFYAIGTVEQAHPRKCEMKNTIAVVTEGAAEGAWHVPGVEVTLKHVPVQRAADWGKLASVFHQHRRAFRNHHHLVLEHPGTHGIHRRPGVKRRRAYRYPRTARCFTLWSGDQRRG